MLKKDVKTPKLMGESEKPNRLSLPPPPPSGQPSYETNAQEAAAELIKILKRENHLSFIAGGWVRDRFLGRVANDVDICSSASIGDLTAILGPNKVMALHANTARVTHGREKFEVTRFKGFWKDPSMMSAFLDASESSLHLHHPRPERRLDTHSILVNSCLMQKREISPSTLCCLTQSRGKCWISWGESRISTSVG